MHNRELILLTHVSTESVNDGLKPNIGGVYLSPVMAGATGLNTHEINKFSYVEQESTETNLRLSDGLLGLAAPIVLLFLFSVRRLPNYPFTA